MLKKENRWVIVLAVLCVGIIAFGLFVSANTADDTAYLVGFNFPIAIVLWAILRYTALRSATKQASISSLFIILASLVIAGTISAERNQREGATAIKEVASEYSKLATEMRANPSGNATPGSTTVDTTQRAQGEFGEYERLMKGFMADTQEQGRDYRAKIEASGFYAILEPESLASDTSLSKSKKIIKEAKDIVTEHEQATRSFKASFRHKLETAEWRSISVDQVLKAYDDGVRKGEPQMTNVFRLEHDVMSESEKLINLLASARNKWSISNGQILFSDQASLNQFNQGIERLKAITEEQRAIIDANIDATSKALTPQNQ